MPQVDPPAHALDVAHDRVSAVLLEMDDAMNLIKAREDLMTNLEMPPLRPGEGGSAPVFDKGDFTTTLGGGKEYVCTGNYLWVDYRYTSSPGVPVLKQAVLDYAKMQYSDTTALGSMKIVVAVNSADSPPDLCNFTLSGMTPQEEILAPYVALANNIKAGLTESDIRAWGIFFRTCQMTFKVLRDNDAKEFETLNHRQEAAAKYMAVAYTPVQWVFKLAQMKKDREMLTGNRLSSEDLLKLFKNNNFKNVKGQEEVTVTFIDNALQIHRQALCYRDVQDALILGAELYSHKSMFDSINKIVGVIRRCKNDPVKQVPWCFCLMLDRVVEGHTSIGEMSHACLFGSTTTKGQIDVLLALLTLKDYLLFEAIPGLGLPPQVLQALQTHFNSVSAYRKKVPNRPIADDETRKKADFAWMASWTLAEKKLAQFIEGILYKDLYKREVKQTLVNKQAATEMFKMEGVSQAWEDILQGLKDAKMSQLGGSAPAEQDGDDDAAGEKKLEPNDQVTFIPADADEATRMVVIVVVVF